MLLHAGSGLYRSGQLLQAGLQGLPGLGRQAGLLPGGFVGKRAGGQCGLPRSQLPGHGVVVAGQIGRQLCLLAMQSGQLGAAGFHAGRPVRQVRPGVGHRVGGWHLQGLPALLPLAGQLAGRMGVLLQGGQLWRQRLAGLLLRLPLLP